MPWSNLPWSIQEFGEDRRGKGEMNCGNLGEGCGKRDFQGDNNNVHCLTSIKFLKQSVQQRDQIMVKQIQYLMYLCNCCNLFNKNLYCFWVLQFYLNPLTPVQAMTSLCLPLKWCHNFWPKLASSILNFCRWKRSFQKYPDQSAWPNGAWDMHKELSEKLGAKFPAITSGFSMVKFAHLDDAFFEVF